MYSIAIIHGVGRVLVRVVGESRRMFVSSSKVVRNVACACVRVCVLGSVH